MDEDPTSIADSIDALAAFLSAHNEEWWAERVAADSRRIRAGDAYGVKSFLSWFGGTGSLNDLVFDPAIGNATADETDALNDELARLRGDAYRRAHTVRRLAG